MSRGHGDKLSRKQEQAVAALLSASTLEQAAAQAGVSLRTLRTWLEQCEFQAAHRQARREVLDGAIAGLLRLCGKAVEALERNLTADKSADQIRAAIAILEHVQRGIEAADLL